MKTLSKEFALELASYTDGLFRVSDLPLLSLQFVLDSDPKLRLIGHFDRKRKDYIEAIQKSSFGSVTTVAGFHSLDPEWIPEIPHAPT